ncbi:MAG TPA: galactokinase family protein [bacterium]|nr:galactokinase family protein [bacterium]HPP02966.1 galactokinase family protein [bacterium]HXK93993.1 galactokinase family protein [bacterium]
MDATTPKFSKKQDLFFQDARTLFHASAPGRLDVMGGIADYSGSLVLQMPIGERTHVWLALREDRQVRVHSESASAAGLNGEVWVNLNEFQSRGTVDYAKARRRLSQPPENGWAAYAVGCFLVLEKEKGIPVPGADLWIHSTVPIGKGVSSSAAIEVAVMAALARAANVKLGPVELPTLAQKVENQVVGAPCGLMDQLTAYLGRENRLLPILCQPDQVSPPCPVPYFVRFVGIDSGVSHAVSGASYREVRTAAFMGYTIAALLEGASKKDLSEAQKKGNRTHLPYKGYLANIPPSVFATRYQSHIPDEIRGDAFLAAYGGIIDPVTSIDPATVYRPRICAAHPVYEHSRVRLFFHLLKSLHSGGTGPRFHQDALNDMGELMYQSHASYSACGLGNESTDEIVEWVRRAGPAAGVHGAKITGGGSGGTVCVLCSGVRGLQTAKRIAREFASRHGRAISFFETSSPGARTWGVRRIP